ncbi:HNH endonuclease [Pseudaestuariivita sp.]|uniref:HNH endonuclease n=1 Tax=Pseudaestuariivita sp. TaxID=2211669 RepID=UPI004059CB0F
MKRTAFFKANNLEFANQQWSWCAVNHKRKVVVFGAFDHNTDGDDAIILDEEWQIGASGRKQPGYSDALLKIELIENHGYRLEIFDMVQGQEDRTSSPSKIAEIDERLRPAELIKIGRQWHAYRVGALSTSAPVQQKYFQPTFPEGQRKEIVAKAIERNPKARKVCVDYFGPVCQVCGIDFSIVYGEIGDGFIHVHHLDPLSLSEGVRETDPVKDLRPVCPNCHAMLHKQSPPYSIQELGEKMAQEKTRQAVVNS